ncbi:phage tail protein [Spirosoma areae]
MATGSFYPPVGFYFSVSIDGMPDDSAFQEVTGLSVSVETQSVAEGGENRFVHQLPLRAKAERLVLKRGLTVSSSLLTWCRRAVEEFSFSPRTIHVFLLDPSNATAPGTPLAAWHLVNAYPVKWSVSAFNAEENSLAVESIEIQYNYFTKSFPV